MTDQDHRDARPPDRLRLRLLLPAVTVIAVVTAVTVESSFPFIDRAVARAIRRPDVIANVLLYMPLGAALMRRKLILVAALAAGISILAESIQLFYPDRYPSPIDVIVNTTGATLGAVVARTIWHFKHWDLRAIELRPAMGILSLAVLASLVAVSLRPPRDFADFSNWDPTFQIAVGDELSGDRRWYGEILGLVILAHPVDGSVIKTLHSRGPQFIRTGWVSELGSALFVMNHRLSESDSLWGRPLLGAERTREMFDDLVRQNTLSVLVWFRGHRQDPPGDGRIVTYSRDKFVRNFSIIQEGRRILFRLRTPQTGDNGLYPPTRTPRRVDANKDVFVAATYDGRVSRVYVDGRLAGRVNLSAIAWRIDFLADSGLPASATLAGMLAATGMLAISGRVVGRRKWILAVSAGPTGSSLLLLVGAAAAVPEFAVWIPAFGLAGGLVVASAADVPKPV